jgi:transcriptional regulator with XRE-family HTH domain
MRDRIGAPPKVDGRMIHRVRELRAQGKTQVEIAVEIGISQGTVSAILRKQGLGGPLVQRMPR